MIDGRAEDVDAATLVLSEPQHPSHEGGLTRAVRPQDRNDFAPVDREVDPVDDRLAVVADPGSSELEDWPRRSRGQEQSWPRRRLARFEAITSR